jgi:tRNA(Ile)-lysidine synthetase-like protein
VHSLAERVLSHIRRHELLHAGDRVGVALSGGIDSVALVRLLVEVRPQLGIVLSVVHFNHKLRGPESDADQEFVVGLARQHDLEFLVDRDDVAQFAAQEHISIETAARELRYGFFRYLIAGDSRPHGLKPDLKGLFVGGGEAPPFPGGRIAPGNRIVPEPPLDIILTGHTLDDQAETVLMRLIRGAGLRGLGAIHPRIVIEDDDGQISGEIVRPLLSTRRSELEQYLKDIGQPWREDSTNADQHFTRNRLRKLVVPLLEREFNPAIARNLAELAEIARGEEDYWQNEVAGWIGTGVHWSMPGWAPAASGSTGLVQIGLRPVEQSSATVAHGPKPSSSGDPRDTAEAVPFPLSAKPARQSVSTTSADGEQASNSAVQSRIDNAPWIVMNASVDRLWFLSEPIAVQRRLIKAIGESAGIPLEFRHVEEILRFAADRGSRGKELSLPLGWRVIRQPQELVFLTPDLRNADSAGDYEYPLLVPGQTVVPEASVVFEVQRVSVEARAGYNPDYLLDAASLTGPLRVRNWRPGDRFWPAHTKSAKKIKELLEERHVTGPARHSWPVVVSADGIVWLRGFPAPACLRARARGEAILINEEPLDRNTVT